MQSKIEGNYLICVTEIVMFGCETENGFYFQNTQTQNVECNSIPNNLRLKLGTQNRLIMM